MKLRITLHTDTPNIDTAHFISKMKELFKKRNVSGEFEIIDAVYYNQGEWKFQYYAVYPHKKTLITLSKPLDFIKLAHTQHQRLEVIYNIFNLTLKQ